MRPHLYVLVDGEPVGVEDVLLWGRWWGQAGEERVVEQTTVGDVQVSTVFLGTDYNFLGWGPPILWETMIFGGERDKEIHRHSSRESAERWHRETVASIAALAQ